jgi:hypothetical protein
VETMHFHQVEVFLQIPLHRGAVVDVQGFQRYQPDRQGPVTW